MVVMFDIDGCLASFGAGFRKVAESLGKDPKLGSLRIEDLDKECWEVVLRSETFWHELPQIVERETFNRIYMLTREHDLYFVTNRHGLRAQRQTERWLEDRGILSPTVIVTPHKGEAAHVIGAHYSIEDNPDNALAIAVAGAKSFLLDRPKINHHVALPPQIKRVPTVDAFLDVIEQA